MAKARRVFVCTSCGSAQARWTGKCPDCGSWDTLEEQLIDKNAGRDTHMGVAAAAALLAQESDHADAGAAGAAPAAVPIVDVGKDAAEVVRHASGIREFDRVLGGGLVAGSVVLIGGEPGIGKSTLLLQGAGGWAGAGHRTLYVTSEESAEQIKLRADRLGNGAGKQPELFLLSDTNLARIVEQVRKVKPAVLVIDSVQMIYKPDVPAAPGSVTQIRRCCADLVYLAKLSGVAVVLVGHVTKEGTLAGPRLLEHLVDTVLSFEGDRYHAHRVVRSVKNRFGTTLEIGLFEMTGRGLREAPEGSGVAAVTGGGEPRPGSIVCPVMSGTRCFLVEVQALTATGFLGAAKRKSSGLDASRLAMLIAVLEQHAGLRLADRDVFASAVGGVRVVEPAADLAILLAIAGAHHRRALAPDTCVIGEVGLGGEVRAVPQIEQRVREASRLGYTRLIAPMAVGKAGVKGLTVAPVKNIDQAIAELG